jgi:uncharacterized protein YjbI with pentapeptide repeats
MALILPSPLVQLLRDERLDEFNELARQKAPDLENADLRMVDLRKAYLVNANLNGAYLRNADMRGVDLSGATMAGASLHEARVSGCYFPPTISADEISLSVAIGTRMRVRPGV